MSATIERYSILNLWRAIDRPVRDTPRAVCDARTFTYRAHSSETCVALHNMHHA